MHDIIYKHPNAETKYDMDFAAELPDDTSVTASSDVTAVNSAGTDASATVVGTESQSGMVLSAVLQAGTDGEDYVITFMGRGNSTSRDAFKLVEMRVRSQLLGE
jgi:hypothetical protein